MRDRLLERLGTVAHRRFLVYLMGPYEAFDLAELVDADVAPEDLAVDFGTWQGVENGLDEVDVLALLERVRDQLRTDPGVNAFLAIDIDIDLEEMDAATQTIEFAKASNAIVFVAPRVGKNLGVGIETGAVLAELPPADHERVAFVHEEGVRSAMIAALSRRWDAGIFAYADEDELVHQIQEFVADLMTRELYGDLPPRDDNDEE